MNSKITMSCHASEGSCLCAKYHNLPRISLKATLSKIGFFSYCGVPLDQNPFARLLRISSVHGSRMITSFVILESLNIRKAE